MRLLFDISRCTRGMRLLERKIAHSSVHRCVLLGYRKSPAGLGAGKPNGKPTGNPRADTVTHHHRGHHRTTVSVLPYSSLGARFRGCKRSQLWLEKPWTPGHISVVFNSSSADATGRTTRTTPVESNSSPPPASLPLDDVKRILKLAHPERLRLSGMLCVLCV